VTLPNPALYFHSARHLKFLQAFCFIKNRIRPLAGVAEYTGHPLVRSGTRMSPGISRNGLSTQPNEFRFLNIAKKFDPDHMDWVCPEMSRLWRYNLQYFDYLHGQNLTPDTKWQLIDSWIQHNPPGTTDAWEPFPVSLRIANWIKWFLRPDHAEDIHLDRHKSLYHQALWLEKNLETHLLANHYFKNGKALFFGGMYFSGGDADRWLKKGTEILSAEIAEQVLGDGGHFERSPMYHAMILEDCLDLFNLCQGQAPEGVPAFRDQVYGRIQQMASFLAAMTHPDGKIALFNDAALGIEPLTAEITDYFERLTQIHLTPPGGKAWSFPETGYYVMAPETGCRLMVDCGPVGPDYQPGHAHSDTLSFELSLNGRRIIVDSGCHGYEDGDIRRYNRGNAGHNTLIIDGKNQSEVWESHRCARRAYPVYATLLEENDETIHFAGAHDGYRRLNGHPVHHRRMTWSGNTIRIVDRVEGNGTHDMESRFHIHPDFNVKIEDERAVIADGETPVAILSHHGSGRIRLTDGWYCPEFGVRYVCPVVVSDCKQITLPFQSEWTIEKKT